MSDDDLPDRELIVRAELMAAELPLREPDWDALSQAIGARLATAGETDEALLAAPVTELESTVEINEPAPAHAADAAPAKPAAPPTSERDAVSLADLARAAVARRGAAEHASIAKESLALASKQRAQPEAAEPPPPPSARAATTVKPPRASGADLRGPWIGVAIAAVGLAAGFGLYVAGQRQQPSVVIATAVAPESPAASSAAPATAQAGPGVPGEARAPEHAAPPAIPEPAVASGVSPEALAQAEPKPSQPVAAGARSAAPASPRAVAAERVVLEEDRPSASPQAKPAAEEPATLRPAELDRDSGIGDRPSAGAAQAAVGAVLGAARSCIAGEPKPSSATIVFGSNGEVSQVSVSGPAQGTPAAACIEAALKKARVQPFAAPTFSLGVTVRPP